MLTQKTRSGTYAASPQENHQEGRKEEEVPLVCLNPAPPMVPIVTGIRSELLPGLPLPALRPSSPESLPALSALLFSPVSLSATAPRCAGVGSRGSGVVLPSAGFRDLVLAALNGGV